MAVGFKVVSGKKIWNTYESIVMNLQLGFSNWTDIDSFEKENKFVKKLRSMIYKESVSELIYRSLTKSE